VKTNFFTTRSGGAGGGGTENMLSLKLKKWKGRSPLFTPMTHDRCPWA